MIYDILLLIYLVGTVAGLWFVFGKAGLAPWKALVPVYNIVLWIRLCGKSWRWYIYMFVPAVNVFCFLLLVQETARVFRRYSFWEQLAAALFPFVYLPWLGLDKKCRYVDPRVEKPAKVGEGRDWLDAIVFALIAATIIRGNIFELYQIPSSSMEKSLLVGDHLMVSKLAYGPRVAMTPLSLPLMHNVVPLIGGKSYFDHPQLPYHRYWGYSEVKRFDAVVFNFPAGDTILSGFPDGKYTYYQALNDFGREAVWSGRQTIDIGEGPVPLGKPVVRPLDKRENYIKRCIGMPGDTLEVRNHVVYINGRALQTPAEAQTTYLVVVDAIQARPQMMLHEVGVSYDDISAALYNAEQLGNAYGMVLPLTPTMASRLAKRYDVLDVQPIDAPADPTLYPSLADSVQSIDNYGPVHIPAKGQVLQLDAKTLPMYRRVIEAYEGNTLEVRGDQILVNGQPATTYTVRQNYYWMMGDNRHHSQDSRYWGYVPEDHIVGRAKTILWSWDKDRQGLFKFRGRLFKKV